MDNSRNDPNFPTTPLNSTPPTETPTQPPIGGSPTSTSPASPGAAPVPTWLPSQPSPAPALSPDPSPSNPNWAPPVDPTTTPAWTPPATPEPTTPLADPAAAASPPAAPSSTVFPPQFSQPGIEADAISATSPLSPSPQANPNPPVETSPAWPPSPLPNQPAQDPPLSNPSTQSAPTFVPPMESTNAPATGGTEHLAPTIPDFLSNLNSSPSTNPTSPTSGPVPLTASDQISSQVESQPTDLSRMTEAGQAAAPVSPVYTPTVSNPETAAPVAPAGIPETVSGNKPKLAKWMVIAGVLVILLLAAAGTYYFLTIGKAGQPEQNFSLPANPQSPLTNPPKQITPTSPPATGSSEATSSGTSAFDSLKKGRQATPSASPR